MQIKTKIRNHNYSCSHNLEEMLCLKKLMFSFEFSCCIVWRFCILLHLLQMFRWCFFYVNSCTESLLTSFHCLLHHHHHQSLRFCSILSLLLLSSVNHGHNHYMIHHQCIIIIISTISSMISVDHHLHYYPLVIFRYQSEIQSYLSLCCLMLFSFFLPIKSLKGGQLVTQMRPSSPSSFT